MSDTFAPTSGGTADTVKEQAGYVASDAKDATKQVASTAKDEARRVTHEAKDQAKNLFHQTTSELSQQANTQQQRVADGLRSVGGELRTMANTSEQSGVASTVVQSVAGQVDSVANWLGDRDPGTLVNDVKQFAREKPAVFIAIALGAGLLAGRVIKSFTDSTDTPMSTGASTGTSTPATTGFGGSGAYEGSTGATSVGQSDPLYSTSGTSTSYSDEPVFEETLQNRGGAL